MSGTSYGTWMSRIATYTTKGAPSTQTSSMVLTVRLQIYFTGIDTQHVQESGAAQVHDVSGSRRMCLLVLKISWYRSALNARSEAVYTHAVAVR